MLTLFGFHTDDNLYTKHAKILECSAQKIGINVHFKSLPQDGWQKIIALKPSFIAEFHRELKEPVLYIDVDAIILEDIKPYFESITEDIGVHFINGNRLLSGTMFINNTPNAYLLMAEWEKRMQAEPDEWDQIILQKLILEWVEAKRVTLRNLPPEYTFIFDTSRKAYGDSVQPIIEHLQASRDIRWIQKYKSRNKFHQWIMSFPFLLRSTRKVVRRHNVVNDRTKKLGIDMQFSLKDIID